MKFDGPLPAHVGIIMDGNGRWAEERNAPRTTGHREGLNSAFLPMAMAAGMTSAITNPLKAELMQAVRGADVVLGNDPECASWIQAYRDPAAASGRRRGGSRRRRKR